jgi:sugar/nucleoside kinase (ribokinase family)
MAPTVMGVYGQICGRTLARAHARAGDRIAIATYLGGSDAFDRAIAEFSEAYADQNESDYDALVQAEKDGRIAVQRGL